MKLSDQIEDMRRRMNEAADQAAEDVTALQRSMLARDAELIKQIEDMIAMQSDNAVTIMNGLLTIAGRYGYLPTPRPASPPAKVSAPATPPPLPPGGARTPTYPPVSTRLGEHAAAHTSMNEILEAAGQEARH